MQVEGVHTGSYGGLLSPKLTRLCVQRRDLRDLTPGCRFSTPRCWEIQLGHGHLRRRTWNLVLTLLSLYLVSASTHSRHTPVIVVLMAITKGKVITIFGKYEVTC